MRRYVSGAATWARTWFAVVALTMVGVVAAATPAEAERPADESVAQADRVPEAEGAPASLRAWLEDLPRDQRRGALARIRHMPEARRRAFFRRWDHLSDAQRSGLQARLERRLHDRRGELHGNRKGVREHYERLTPAERGRFRAKAHRWRDMKPSERARMRHRLEHFSSLSEAEQEALIERSFPNASPEERARKLIQLRSAAE